MSETKSHIAVQNLTSVKDDKIIFSNFSIDIPLNRFVLLSSSEGIMLKHFLKIIGGIIQPDEGNILIENEDLYTSNLQLRQQIKKKISFVFENGGLISNLSIEKNLLLPLDFHFPEIDNLTKIKRILAFFEEFEINVDLNKRPSDLELELVKQIGFIRALLTEPDIIFYDEPLRFTDSHGKRNILRKMTDLKNNHVTQIIKNLSSTDFLKKVDWIVDINKNKTLFQGTPQQYIANSGINFDSSFN